MDKRITELEILVAHQDDTIKALNEEIIHHGRSIDRMTKRLDVLEKMMKQAAEPDGPAPEDEPPPPHY